MLNELVDQLDNTPVAAFMRDTVWAVPLVQTVHILAIAAVFTASLLLVLSTFGLLGDDWSVSRRIRMLASWSWGGLLVLALSGTLMVAGEPARSLLNPLFQIKIILLVFAALTTWQLATKLHAARAAHQHTGAPAIAKVLAVVAFTLWIAIICAGRWIAYVEA